MSSEYYSLEKAAEVLGLPMGEINRLRERSQLRAFRDGASWKFRKVDVDNFLAETIKNRGVKKSSDSDFDLLSSDEDGEEMPTLLADSSSFDSLMEDGIALGDDLIDAAPASAKPKSTKPSPAKEVASQDDGLSLADDDLMLGTDDLVLADDSPAGATASHSDVDLAIDDDDLMLESADSNQLNLAGDSGLSLLEVADDIELQEAGQEDGLQVDDDDDILSLIDDDLGVDSTSTIAIPVEDDFQLTPDADSVVDESESASQVIALEEDNMFGAPIEQQAGFAPAESSFGAAPAAGFGNSPFGAAGPGEFMSSGPSFIQPTSSEANYPVWSIAVLVISTCFMSVGALMMIDLIRNIWSWNEAFVINSSIMELVAGFTK